MFPTSTGYLPHQILKEIIILLPILEGLNDKLHAHLPKTEKRKQLVQHSSSIHGPGTFNPGNIL